MTRRIQVMADYGCHPIWLDDGPLYDNVDPRTLPIPDGLAERLEQWAAEYDATLDQDYPPDSGFATEADRIRFAITGERLARELKAELGEPDTTFEYHDIRTATKRPI